MSFTITARDPRTGKLIETYTRKGSDEALGMVQLLTSKGYSAEITEGVKKGRPGRSGKTRENPGELLILSGFSANPEAPKTLVADHDLVEVEDAFREFHDGADPKDILEVPDSAAPKGTPKELFLLGELVSVVYEVPRHSGKSPGPPFRHFLGEVGHSSKVVKGNRPLLCGTSDGKYLVIVHRHAPGSKKTYRVRPEGIVG